MRISYWSSDGCSSDLLKVTDIPMDCHLMIDQPERWAPPYAEAGAYNVTFHAEATDNPVGVARDIRSEERRGGKECVSTCSFPWSVNHSNNKYLTTIYSKLFICNQLRKLH